MASAAAPRLAPAEHPRSLATRPPPRDAARKRREQRHEHDERRAAEEPPAHAQEPERDVGVQAHAVADLVLREAFRRPRPRKRPARRRRAVSRGSSGQRVLESAQIDALLASRDLEEEQQADAPAGATDLGEAKTGFDTLCTGGMPATVEGCSKATTGGHNSARSRRSTASSCSVKTTSSQRPESWYNASGVVFSGSSIHGVAVWLPRWRPNILSAVAAERARSRVDSSCRRARSRADSSCRRARDPVRTASDACGLRDSRGLRCAKACCYQGS